LTFDTLLFVIATLAAIYATEQRYNENIPVIIKNCEVLL